MRFRGLCQGDDMVPHPDYDRNTEAVNPSIVFLAKTGGAGRRWGQGGELVLPLRWPGHVPAMLGG